MDFHQRSDLVILGWIRGLVGRSVPNGAGGTPACPCRTNGAGWPKRKLLHPIGIQSYRTSGTVRTETIQYVGAMFGPSRTEPEVRWQWIPTGQDLRLDTLDQKSGKGTNLGGCRRRKPVRGRPLC